MKWFEVTSSTRSFLSFPLKKFFLPYLAKNGRKSLINLPSTDHSINVGVPKIQVSNIKYIHRYPKYISSLRLVVSDSDTMMEVSFLLSLFDLKLKFILENYWWMMIAWSFNQRTAAAASALLFKNLTLLHLVRWLRRDFNCDFALFLYPKSPWKSNCILDKDELELDPGKEDEHGVPPPPPPMLHIVL